ncbi:TPA: hypothetical protein ACWQWC_002460 [Escherichia coli]|jgi:hypothetical protein|uniref:Terminase n=2 Tax=Enterobacteriaceae TaxID=543 RepID=A0A8B3MCU4_ECOLX|nr:MULTISPECIES: hypothetical protein [Enterobacteriaceae]ECF7539306.1 hypothetical protein [Salmonella enterica subsp. enterica]EDY0674284.1 hypothetical protein [Salmonella enterica subsp. enterica serovar Brancaster]HBV4332894.1 hypothetical protein [Citrobacter freundii]ASG50807.1 hypothetical protein CES94_19090 [Escherichia coli]EAA7871213.1 hypothetical protein [Salmonella enterica]
MAKPDWGELQQRFLSEHAKTGISPKEWCEAQGLNYSTAKRYIKIANGSANSQKKSANKTANSQKEKVAKSKPPAGLVDNCEVAKPSNSPETKRAHYNSRPGNQNALKHGGYGRRMLLSDAITEDAQALTLDDELFWLRAANLTAAENIGRWQTELEIADGDTANNLHELISSAQKAMHRNTARIESLEFTKASIEHRLASTDKVSLEADRLRRDAGVDDGNGDRDLNDFYSDIQTDPESGPKELLDDTGSK